MGTLERATELNRENLLRLIQGETLALAVTNFVDRFHCAHYSRRILKSGGLEPYNHEVIKNGQLVQEYFGVDRLGLPFNSTYSGKNSAKELYYLKAAQDRRSLRNIFSPYLSPIDKLRLELDEAFPAGAQIASFDGEKMFSGIVRLTRAELSHRSAEEPHFDALPETYAKLDGQFAANIYLQLPPQGGELELWDVPPLPPLSSPPPHWREQLPKSLKLCPQKGDLILFNCRRPHAVSAFKGKDRLSLQLFIGYRERQPLALWN